MPSPLDSLLLQNSPGVTQQSCLPMALLSGTGADPRPRLRVDPGKTAFFEGREFRAYHEFNIAAGQSQFLRFVVPAPLNVIIHGRDVTVVDGKLRFALSSGGTPAGTWTPKTVFPVNACSNLPAPLYVGQVTSDSGGTVTGQNERDILLIETPTGQASTVNLGISQVGLPANTYYVELRNTGSGAVRGLYRVHWEEVQAQSERIMS